MNIEKTLIWSLRIVTTIIILVPLIYYYLASGSLLDFVMPSLTIPPSLLSFNPSSLRITAVDYEVNGETYLLSIGIYNAGDIGIGLKEASGTISVPSLNIRGRFILQSSFFLKPKEERKVNIEFLLESGTRKDLKILVSQRLPIEISGEAVLILNSTELPLNVSIKSWNPW
ncbi:MAG: hypothetical protein JTT17_08200 [Candidatus Brockarchaeota archaeon]|nr:hypothetical protein [Candidatus Brockarchaeota archaeon]